MAEGYLRYFAREKADVYSAGTEAHGLNPYAVACMSEDGIDISGHTSDTVDKYRHMDFDIVITVCDRANEHCPYFSSKARRFHRAFPDPARAKGTEEEIMEQFRHVRQLIREYCRCFVSENLQR